jgi:hypothetical protein
MSGPVPSNPAATPALRQPASDSCAALLETEFPRILDSIMLMWGYPELNLYFRKLAVDGRSGRQGFPPDVWDEIHMLACVHELIVLSP